MSLMIEKKRRGWSIHPITYLEKQYTVDICPYRKASMIKKSKNYFYCMCSIYDYNQKDKKHKGQFLFETDIFSIIVGLQRHIYMNEVDDDVLQQYLSQIVTEIFRQMEREKKEEERRKERLETTARWNGIVKL